MKPKVEGLTPKEFMDKLKRRRKLRPKDKIWSSKQMEIQQAKAKFPSLFSLIPTEEAFDLLVDSFYQHGLTPKDFEDLSKRLEHKIKEEARKKEEKRKEVEKQQQVQKEPFYRFGLMIAYGGHLPQHGSTGEKLLKEIRSFPKDTKMSILRRLKEGEFPKPLRTHNYTEKDTQQAIQWLTSELLVSEPEETETKTLLKKTINAFGGH